MKRSLTAPAMKPSAARTSSLSLQVKASDLARDRSVPRTRLPSVVELELSVQERFKQFVDILRDANASEVHACFNKFSAEHLIDKPTFKAMWKSTKRSNGSGEYDADLMVDVQFVSGCDSDFDANVVICEPYVTNLTDELCEQKLIERLFSGGDLTIPLFEISPIKTQDNAGNAKQIAEAIECLRFFYTYLWREYDLNHSDDVPFRSSRLPMRLQIFRAWELGMLPSFLYDKILSLRGQQVDCLRKMERIVYSLRRTHNSMKTQRRSHLELELGRLDFEFRQRQNQLLSTDTLPGLKAMCREWEYGWVGGGMREPHEPRSEEDGGRTVFLVSPSGGHSYSKPGDVLSDGGGSFPSFPAGSHPSPSELYNTLIQIDPRFAVKSHNDIRPPEHVTLLTHALSRLKSGDAVVLLPGVHISPDIKTHRGATLADIQESFILLGWGTRESVIVKNTDGSDFFVHVDDSSKPSNVFIENITFRQVGGYDGVLLARRGCVIVKNCSFYCTSSGVVVHEGATLEMSSSLVEGAITSGIEVHAGATVKLFSNTISRCGAGDDICSENVGGVLAHVSLQTRKKANLALNGNIIVNNWGFGLAIRKNTIFIKQAAEAAAAGLMTRSDDAVALRGVNIISMEDNTMKDNSEGDIGQHNKAEAKQDQAMVDDEISFLSSVYKPFESLDDESDDESDSDDEIDRDDGASSIFSADNSSTFTGTRDEDRSEERDSSTGGENGEKLDAAVGDGDGDGDDLGGRDDGFDTLDDELSTSEESGSEEEMEEEEMEEEEEEMKEEVKKEIEKPIGGVLDGTEEENDGDLADDENEEKVETATAEKRGGNTSSSSSKTTTITSDCAVTSVSLGEIDIFSDMSSDEDEDEAERFFNPKAVEMSNDMRQKVSADIMNRVWANVVLHSRRKSNRKGMKKE